MRIGKRWQSPAKRATPRRPVYEVDDLWREGATLNIVGEIYHAQGQGQQALDTYRQALVIRRKADDRFGEGTTLNNMGETYRARGELQGRSVSTNRR